MKEDRPRHLRLVPTRRSDPPGPVVDLEGAFRAYSRYVGHIVLRIVGRPDEVEDLVQEVFLDAHGRIEGLRDPEAIRGWLRTIAVRKSVRHLKRRRVRKFFGLDEGYDYGELADRGASAHDRALVSQIYRLLDALPADQRSAWVLRVVEGEKVERVAELCGCSLATAKRRIAAAQAALDQELSDA
jgi:RNA polymerase sigma-70 factor (ECF subfamily)